MKDNNPNLYLRDSVKKITKGSSVVFFGQGLSKFLSLVFAVLIGRLLGPSSFGVYALAMTVTALSTRFSRIGLDKSLIRYIPVYQNRELQLLKGLMTNAFIISGFVSISLGVTLFFIAPWVAQAWFKDSSLTVPLKVSSLIIPLTTMNNLIIQSLRGFQSMTKLVTLRIFQGLVKIPFSALLVMLGFGIVGVLWGVVGALIMTIVLGVYLLFEITPTNSFKSERKTRTRAWLRYAVPLFLAGFSQLIMTKTDIVMLGFFASNAEVGAYKGAVNLSIMITFGLAAVNTAFAPLISEIYEKDNKTELGHLYRFVTRWIAVISLIVSLPLVLYPFQILKFYGSGFTRAATPLVALVGFYLIGSGVGSVGQMLQMSGHQDYVLFINVVTAILNVGLNLWWIPKFGILGAAFATGIPLAANNVLELIIVRKKMGLLPFGPGYFKLIVPVAISILSNIILGLFSIPWYSKLIVVYLIFGVFFFLFCATEEDWLLIYGLKKKIRSKNNN